MSGRRFRYGGEVYEWASPNDVTLRDLLLLERDTAELGKPVHMGEVNRIVTEFKGLTKAEGMVHPDAGWMLAISIWLAIVKKRRDAGDLDPVLFADAIGADLSTFEDLPDPGDHADPQRPRKAGAKKRTQKRPGSASARAAAVDTDESPTD